MGETMPTEKIVRVPVTVPEHLLKFADRLARQKKSNRSRILCELLEEKEQQLIQESMKEGYKELAGLSQELADMAFPAAREAVLDFYARIEGQEGI